MSRPLPSVGNFFIDRNRVFLLSVFYVGKRSNFFHSWLSTLSNLLWIGNIEECELHKRCNWWSNLKVQYILLFLFLRFATHTQASQASVLGLSLRLVLIKEVTKAGKMAHLRQAPSTTRIGPSTSETE